MAQSQQSNWEADKMLNVYIHDYMLKRGLHASAKTFMAEGKVATDPVAIDAPGGFLFEWWSVFWDIFIARTNEKHSEPAAAYIEAQQIKGKEHQQLLQMQQLQLLQQCNAQMQRRDPGHSSIGGPVNPLNSEGMMGQSSASILAMKMYEERMKHPHSIDSDTSPSLIDANRLALLKSAANHQGQSMQVNSGSMSTLQQMQSRNQLANDLKSEVNLSAARKSLPMDPSSIYGQLQSKSVLGVSGLNQAGNNLPLKGWPLTGIDQLRPNLGLQAQKPVQTQNQLLLASQQQQVLQAQIQAQTNLGNSANHGDMDPRRFGGLPRSMNVKDGPSTRNDGSLCFSLPVQSSSPQTKMAQMQQAPSQQQELLQQQPMQQNNKRRKQHSSSGPANSTGTGNTVAPYPNSPPSTHTPGDGMTTSSSLQHVNSVPKSLMTYGSEGAGALASTSNILDDIEHFADVDNVELFLSNDGGDGRDQYGILKQPPADLKKESSKGASLLSTSGFTFAEVGCIRTRNSKVTCCHFSSDGKLLASAGHDKKAVLWNMDTLQTQNTPEEHQSVITDIRFRPNSSQLATVSYDKSVRLWDAANPSYHSRAYTTHNSPVMSLDFHPKKTDLFCFCDEKNEIHYWTLNPFACSRISKGATAQLRFQPRVGQFLAAAADKVVSIFDVEIDRLTHSFQGHFDTVNSVCWDANGELLASVSKDSVRIWSMTSGECTQEITSNGNQFHSCAFHPSYSALLVIGGISSLELWNIGENRRMTVPAHDEMVSGLAQSSVCGMIASASHDGSVKIWK